MRSRPRQIGLLCLLVTAVGWGLNWPAMKLLLSEWPPLSARGTAGVIAALALALLATLRGERLFVPARLAGRLIAAAALNVTAWMGLTTLSLLWLDAGQGALLAYTMPIWATLLAWPVLGERPTAGRFVALVLGVAGVAVLLGVDGGSGIAFALEGLPGVALALGAAMLFALGTVGLRSPLRLPPLAATAWQVGLGCVPMVAAGVVFEAPDPGVLSAAGWAAMAYMTAVPMGACYLCWFAALRRLPPAVASVGTLLTPLVGVVAAALALGVAGVAVLLGHGSGDGATLAPGRLPGVALALGAAVLFALGTVALRSPLGLPPLAATAWQVGLGCLPLLAAGLLFEAPDPDALSAAGWAAMAYMTAVPMGACYLCWFAALRRLPPAVASVGTLLTPLVGVVAAALALGEPLGLRQALALALTLGGVSLALRRA